MFAQVQNPDHLEAQELDAYLAQGWFRMGQTIFTTNFIRFQQQIHSTIWLRILLDSYVADNTQVKLFKRNSEFRISFKLAEITEEKEKLYSIYKQTVSFPASDSLQFLLLDKRNNSEQPATKTGSIFTTYEVNVHDGDRLIACGFFDLGAVSAEGITSFYDPEYKKHSLGKYLIYLKIKFCKELGMQYFYPGYFVPGNPHFDYKLSIGNEVLQFLQLSTQTWEPIQTFLPENIPYDVMRVKLLQVHEMLSATGQYSKLLKYNFFDANFVQEMRDTGLLDFPILLFCGVIDNVEPILVYDVRDGMYHLLTCVPAWKPFEVNSDEEFYSDYFLMPVAEIYRCEEGEEIGNFLIKLKNEVMKEGKATDDH
ncbi:MAG: arginyl-tRNA--protein arginylyltransferase [Cyclobacteriaceae bacterium]|nr:arginyl-tRNA--protein arginylyltransferase [Cyclobacteriaceae bacterium]